MTARNRVSALSLSSFVSIPIKKPGEHPNPATTTPPRHSLDPVTIQTLGMFKGEENEIYAGYRRRLVIYVQSVPTVLFHGHKNCIYCCYVGVADWFVSGDIGQIRAVGEQKGGIVVWTILCLVVT